MTATLKKHWWWGWSCTERLLLLLWRRECPRRKRTSVEWQKRKRLRTYREQGKNKNTCCLSLQHDVVTQPGWFIITYSFCIVYKYVVLSAGTKEVPRAPCLISHIPHRFQASWDIVWTALDSSFWMHSITRRRANYSARGGGVAEGTSRGKTPGKKW